MNYRKDKTIMLRMSEADLNRLNEMCEVQKMDRCELIRFLIRNEYCNLFDNSNECNKDINNA